MLMEQQCVYSHVGAVGLSSTGTAVCIFIWRGSGFIFLWCISMLMRQQCSLLFQRNKCLCLLEPKEEAVKLQSFSFLIPAI